MRAAWIRESSAPIGVAMFCEVREKMTDFLQREHPDALPRTRQVNIREDGGARESSQSAKTSGSA
jgi:hypothetical protein